MTKEILEDLVESPVSRRTFAKRIGIMSATIAGTSLLGGFVPQASATTFSDIDILNFALNLEYLDAEYYTMATFGTTLEASGVIPSSAVSGPTLGGHAIANLGASPIAYLATHLRMDEQGHVRYLRSVLGSAAIKKPTINLDALGIGFRGWGDVLALGSALEDTGMSAFIGAAPLIQNKTYLAAAGRFLGTEAQHLGMLRTHAVDHGIAVPKLDALDVPTSPASPFAVGKTGLSIARSFQQILNIAYGGKSTPGGFYPDGVNGKIR